MAKVHRAKRLFAGEYEYRGYHIEWMGAYDSAAKHWNITAPGADQAEDAAQTLGGAKEAIDYWIARDA